jgi:hypothetical protein
MILGSENHPQYLVSGVYLRVALRQFIQEHLILLRNVSAKKECCVQNGLVVSANLYSRFTR